DQDALVVAALCFGDGVGDAVLRGDLRAGIRKYREWQPMLLDGEVVVAAVLGRDGGEQRAHSAHLGMQIAPGFEFSDAVGTPAAAEELDYQRAEREQIGGADGL